MNEQTVSYPEATKKSLSESYIVYENLLKKKLELEVEYDKKAISEDIYELELKRTEDELRSTYKNSLKCAKEYIMLELGFELSPYQKGTNLNAKFQAISSIAKKTKEEFLNDLKKAESIIEDRKAHNELTDEKHTLLTYALLINKEYFMVDLVSSASVSQKMQQTIHAAEKNIEKQELKPKGFNTFVNMSLILVAVYLLYVFMIIGIAVAAITNALPGASYSVVYQELVGSNLLKTMLDIVIASHMGSINTIFTITNVPEEYVFFAIGTAVIVAYFYIFIPLVFIGCKVLRPTEEVNSVKKLYMGYVAYGYATIFASILFFSYFLMMFPDLYIWLTAMEINASAPVVDAVNPEAMGTPGAWSAASLVVKVLKLLILEGALILIILFKVIITYSLYRSYLRKYFGIRNVPDNKETTEKEE